MVGYLKEFYTFKFEEMGEPQVREKIIYGIERAEEYSITLQRDVCMYIDLMFKLGFDFDHDPELQWMSNILNDSSMTPTEKINKLFDKVS